MPLKAAAITPTWPAVWSPTDSSGALNRNPPMKWAGSRNCLQRLHDQEPPRVRGELPRGCAPRDTRRTSRGGPESWRMPGITRGELWERSEIRSRSLRPGDTRVDAYAVTPVLCRGDRVGDLTLPPHTDGVPATGADRSDGLGRRLRNLPASARARARGHGDPAARLRARG